MFRFRHSRLRGRPFVMLIAGVVAGLLPLATLSPKPKSAPKAMLPSSTDQLKETFCGAPACPQEVLFRLKQCPSKLDLKLLSEEVSRYLFDTTHKDDKILISSIAGNCIFAARSSTRSITDLLKLFQVIQTRDAKTTASLAQVGLNDFAVAEYQPNLLVQLDEDNVDRTHRVGQRLGPWWFGSQFPGADASAAWKKFGKGSRRVVVGVLDTGIFEEHPDLRKNVWRARRSFELKLEYGNVRCAKGTFGFNVLATDDKNVCLPRDDGSGHGTHVSGIIGASDDSTKGPIGISRKVRLLALKIADNTDHTCISNVLKAIDFAIRLKAQIGINLRVLNNSYYVRSDCPEQVSLLRGKIEDANAANMLFVASAGQEVHVFPDSNDDDIHPHYPSGFYLLNNVVSVTAIDETGNFTFANGETANYGQNSVHLGAPGTEIFATDLPSTGGFKSRNGTSMAAAFVSGAAALMLSVAGCSRLTAGQIKEKILRGASPTPALSCKTTTNGRLNVFQSIALCSRD